jgi:tRNA pseudouridine55 synthase
MPPARNVTIHAIKLERLCRGDLTVLVDCGSGMYVRSLARDLGERIGCGGYVKELRRLRIGGTGVGAAVSLDELESMGSGSLWNFAERDTRTVLASFPRAIIKSSYVGKLVDGLPPEALWFRDDVSKLRRHPWVLVSDERGVVIALASGRGPEKGFPVRLRRVLAR